MYAQYARVEQDIIYYLFFSILSLYFIYLFSFNSFPPFRMYTNSRRSPREFIRRWIGTRRGWLKSGQLYTYSRKCRGGFPDWRNVYHRRRPGKTIAIYPSENPYMYTLKISAWRDPAKILINYGEPPLGVNTSLSRQQWWILHSSVDISGGTHARAPA